MSETASYIAVDLGAESGRVMLGTMAAGKLHLEELHRFSNGPVEVNGSLRWDFDRLLSEVKTGIGLAAKKAKSKPLGVGVDTWGVDFGLLGRNDELLGNPSTYRDRRTSGIFDRAFPIVSRDEIFDATGLQFMEFNTLYQLVAMQLGGSDFLAKPFGAEELRKKVRSLLDTTHAMEEG